MPDITASLPSIGSEVCMSFKEPFNYFFRNKFNTNDESIRFKVVSVIDMRDSIRNDLKDPFSSIYIPAGLTEVEYKIDLQNEVAVYSLSFKNAKGIDCFFRIPANYIASVSSESDIEYINKTLVLSLGYLPLGADISSFNDDLKDFIEDRLGVRPEVSEVSVGAVELLTISDHEARETIRNNTASVYKTNTTKLEELTIAYTEIVNRLDDLNISLS